MTETPPAMTSQDLQVSHVETEPNTPLCESDYDAIAAAVMETDRGRWFLQEYAQRNRNADTQSVLTAIDKLEERINEEASTPKEATSIALLGHDLLDLAGAISQVKKEVAELGGQGSDPDHFNSATVELEAIVEQTESATSEILEAAEKIQEVAWILREEGASETQCDIIESKVVEVYTACSFQDLTGQRSNKVVQLVGYVERRIASMMSILGLSDDEISASSPKSEFDEPHANDSASGLTPQQRNDERPDADLLNGPAMSGEGNEQGDVDALFGEITFDQAPAIGDETSASTDQDPMVMDANVDDDEDSGFDAPDFSQESDLSQQSPTEAIDQALDQASDEASDQVSDEDLDDGIATDSVEMPADIADNQEFAAIASQDQETETTSEVDDGTQATAKADFGEDYEHANTPEAADIFGFDVYGDAQIVELYDAEILSQPAEEALLESAQETSAEQTEQDIFEVDPLSFGGETFGAADDPELDTELEAEMDGAPKKVIGLPGDFDVDSHVADMFVGSSSQEAKSSDSAQTASDNEHDFVNGQDIFEADCIDVGSTSASIDDVEAELATDREADEVFADVASTGPDDRYTDDQKLDVLENDDTAAMAADALVPEDQVGDDGSPDEADPVQAAAETFNEGAMDDALIAIDADSATQVDEPVSPLETAQAKAAEELMKQALAATNVAGEETHYPDDEYTAEERIALFS